MEKKTSFIKLAERIGEDINAWNWYCCNNLPKKDSKFFTNWFQPTRVELEEYRHMESAWMMSKHGSDEEDNNLRILALLFAEQIYLDKSQPRNPNI